MPGDISIWGLPAGDAIRWMIPIEGAFCGGGLGVSDAQSLVVRVGVRVRLRLEGSGRKLSCNHTRHESLSRPSLRLGHEGRGVGFGLILGLGLG